MDAGIAVNFTFYNNYNYIITYHRLSTGVPYTVVKNKYPEMKGVWASYPIKAGVVVDKHLEIYAAYWLPAIVTGGYVNFSGQISYYQAGINYLFGK